MAVCLRQCQAPLSDLSQCLPVVAKGWRTTRSLATPSKRFLSLPVKPEEVDFENGELYNYTTRRFLIDEKRELASRRTRFDVNALCAVAAKYPRVGGDVAVQIDKLLDGEYSKSYMIRYANGAKVMATLPNANDDARVSMLAENRTASFVHWDLGVPSTRQRGMVEREAEPDVASAFTLVAAPLGVPLSSVWRDLDATEQENTMRAVMGYMRRWANFTYPGYGSLCNKRSSDIATKKLSFDVEAATGKASRYSQGFQRRLFGSYDTLDEFRRQISQKAIGRVAARLKAMDPQIIRSSPRITGPWETSDQYLESVTAKAVTITRSWADRRRTTSIPLSSKRAAQLYHAMLPYITPQVDSLLSPSLWKRNITANTIYVNPESPSQITAFLDWRHAEVVPSYREVNQPPFFDSSDSAGGVSSTETIHDMYVRLISDPMPQVLQALQFKKTTEYQLLESAHEIGKDNGIAFLSRAIEYIQNERSDIAEMLEDDPELSIAKLSKNLEQKLALHRRKEDLMQEVRTRLGDLVAEDWTLRPEDYDSAKMILASAKKRLGRKELEELWPFDI